MGPLVKCSNVVLLSTESRFTTINHDYLANCSLLKIILTYYIKEMSLISFLLDPHNIKFCPADLFALVQPYTFLCF